MADGGTITGPGYLFGCMLRETASPASASTILIAGPGRHPGHRQPRRLHPLGQRQQPLRRRHPQLGRQRHQPRDDPAAVEQQHLPVRHRHRLHTLTNLGTISSGAGTGGKRLISGTLDNQGTSPPTADYLDITGTTRPTAARSPGPATSSTARSRRPPPRPPPRPSWSPGQARHPGHRQPRRLHPLGPRQQPLRRRRPQLGGQRQPTTARSCCSRPTAPTSPTSPPAPAR